MVESAQVDWFAHDGDPIGVISEVLAYDKAFKVAMYNYNETSSE